MESRIPLPTDNIFKFYALFGLLLFIFCSSSIIYVEHSTNELVFQSVIELESVKQIANPSPVDTAKKLVLEKRIEIALSDRKSSVGAIGVFLAISIASMVFGFVKWHREVQPIQDKIAKLQLEKLQYEVDQLRKPMASSVVEEAPEKESSEAED
jgi:hypothetical protein